MYRVQSSIIFAFIVSAFVVSPFVLFGSYVIGAVWSMLDEDQAVFLWFLGIPTFVATNYVAILIVFRKICMYFVSQKVMISTTIFAWLLSIPMQLVSVLALSPFWGLIIEQTEGEVALTWIIISLSACILTIGVCGLVVLSRVDYKYPIAFDHEDKTEDNIANWHRRTYATLNRNMMSISGGMFLILTWYIMSYFIAVLTKTLLVPLFSSLGNDLLTRPPGSLVPAILLITVSIFLFALRLIHTKNKTLVSWEFAFGNVFFMLSLLFIQAVNLIIQAVYGSMPLVLPLPSTRGLFELLASATVLTFLVWLFIAQYYGLAAIRRKLRR